PPPFFAGILCDSGGDTCANCRPLHRVDALRQRPSIRRRRPLVGGFRSPAVPPKLVSDDALAPRLSVFAVHLGIASTVNSIVGLASRLDSRQPRSSLLDRRKGRASGGLNPRRLVLLSIEKQERDPAAGCAFCPSSISDRRLRRRPGYRCGEGKR